MIGVVGGGTMGAGIATSFLVAGESVVLVEMDSGRVEAAVGQVDGSLERLARKDDSLDVEAVLARLETSTDIGGTKSCRVVIEAVPEILKLKRSLFDDLDKMHAPEVILASNTSSLSVSAIASGLRHADRVIGMHFFNPVPVSLLVEIVVGEETTESVIDQVNAMVGLLGKTPIVVSDSPGFASSRLGLALGLEAIRMLEEGVASAADIDKAMELGYRHPMGPLRLTDLVGLDVRLAIAQHLHAELGDRFEPPALLFQMVEEGKLGKKTGRGFFEW